MKKYTKIWYAIGVLFISTHYISCNKKNVLFTLSTPQQHTILQAAAAYKNASVITITSFVCPRSQGGIHDFYSEGDYWWPNPNNPNAPYIRKDGVTNPNNFSAHRQALIRLNQIAGTLTSAFLLTGKKEYLKHIVPHLQAWFINSTTKMNPSLWYAQAIKGKVSGRGIGIIDTVHLIEVARCIEIMEKANAITGKDLTAIKNWFKNYLQWLTTSSFGIAERDNGNNHSVTWALQVATFAHLVNNKKLLAFCSNFYKNTLLPAQMATNGSFPKELERTKPYGYSIFVIDAMATLCQVVSTKTNNLFTYTTPTGKSLQKGMSFIYPYLKNKNTWPYAKDVLFWDQWPVNQPSLLFTGLAFNNTDYIALWKKLPFNYTNPEVIRNMPVKYPLLWLTKG